MLVYLYEYVINPDALLKWNEVLLFGELVVGYECDAVLTSLPDVDA